MYFFFFANSHEGNKKCPSIRKKRNNELYIFECRIQYDYLFKPSEKSTLKFCNQKTSEISHQVNMKKLLFTIKNSKNYEVKIPFLISSKDKRSRINSQYDLKNMATESVSYKACNFSQKDARTLTCVIQDTKHNRLHYSFPSSLLDP